MERLTKVDAQGRLLAYLVNNAGLPAIVMKRNPYHKLIQRLAEYEDTGLEPDEIVALQAMATQLIVKQKSVVLNLFDNPKNEHDVAEVGSYVYAKEAAEEYGFVKNNLYEILDTNGFDAVRVMNAEGKILDMSVEYFSSRSTLN